MYRETEKYYIYIYIHIMYIYLVGPGNSLDASVPFPLFTFPLRFRYVSGTFSSTFPLRFHWASACQTGIAQKLAQHLCVCFGHGRPSKSQAKPVLAKWFRLLLSTRSRVRAPRSTFSERARRYAANYKGSGRQMRRGRKGRTNPNAPQRFHRVSVNVSFRVSATFPQRFRQRFRRVSVNISVNVSINVSVTLPLGRCVPDGNYPETLPMFPGPTKYIYIYIYIY